MNSPAILNFDALLSDIPGDCPVGVDLREWDGGVLYWELKGIRDQSSTIERKFLEQPDNDDYSLSNCRWGEVVSQVQLLLVDKTKDFDLVAWLCEGLVREEGFAGLRDGLRLARGLAEQDPFWDQLYPLPDDGDFSTRVRMFRGLFEGDMLKYPIQRVPLTAHRHFTTLEYEQAERFKNVPDAGQRLVAIGPGMRDVTLAQIEADARDSWPSAADFCRCLAGDLEACIAEAEQLCALLQEKCGRDDTGQPVAPYAREISAVLQSCLKVVNLLYGDRIGRDAGASESSEAGEGAAGDNLAGAGGGDLPARVVGKSGAGEARELNRDTAIEYLSRLAEFFEHAEPSNPAAFQIKKAIRCGQMSLPEILKEAIPDVNLRHEAFLRLGIDIPEEPEDGG